MEPFKNSEVDVLVLENNVDEILFQQTGEYKGKKFVSIESNYEEISKDLGGQVENEAADRNRIPENDITPFCLWIKEELKEHIGKVTISRRLKDTPAIITGNMSSSLRMMMQMMESHGQLADSANEMNRAKKESVLELNAAHPIVLNLNQLRKQNKTAASLVLQRFLDNVLVQSGIPFDLQAGCENQYKMIDSYLELIVNASADSDTGSAKRATISDKNDNAQEVIIESGNAGSGDKASAMKKARDQVKQAQSSGQKITINHTVNDEDMKRK